MRALVLYETSGAMRRALEARGWDVWTADMLPALEPTPRHIVTDLESPGGLNMEALVAWIKPDLIIAHPTCTYLTCSAEWAYTDGPYHQKVKPETLVGAERRAARESAISTVKRIWKLLSKIKVIENPVGALSKRFMKPSQTVQPYDYGDDASKRTCLWMDGVGPMTADPKNKVPPRMVDGRPRWGNQTDSGQNKLSPSSDRWRKRSETYPGIAIALAEHVPREVKCLN